MNRRTALRALGGALVVGVAGCLGRRFDDPKTVRMVGLRFKPARISVDVGRSVEWVNDSDVGHTVTAYEDRIPAGAPFWASGGFATERAARENLAGGLINAGETYGRTFETAGEHAYYCIPHEGSGMTGIVAVE